MRLSFFQMPSLLEKKYKLVDMQYLSPFVWGFFILKWHSAPFKNVQNCCAGLFLRLAVHGCSMELKTFKFLQICTQFSHVD